MAKAVIMPKFGFTQETAVILKWLVKPGDYVEHGDPIAEVSTDKVDMEVEAPASGVLDGVRYQEGDEVPVTDIIAYIRQPDETLPADALSPASPPAPSPAQPPAPSPPRPSATSSAKTASPVARRVAQDLGVDIAEVPGSGPGGRITRRDVETYAREKTTSDKVRAVPAARRLARELGVDLTKVKGSGPSGRVQSIDVRAAHETLQKRRAAPQPEPKPAFETIPLTGMRAAIARRMQQSWSQAPHIVFEADIDAGNMLALSQQANQLLPDDHPKVSLTAIIVKACAWALKRHPRMNARLQQDAILLLPEIHIGVAVALDDGLIVPVVHRADGKSLGEIAAEIANLAQRARSGKLRPQDVSEGTFTVSNLGMFGIKRFTAIINPPETAILAVGRVSKRITADENDEIRVRPMMTITLSADHRVVDGAIAALFLRDLSAALTQPETMLL
ncbi:MAG: 2-oxo acid dehydrogenase subunit E2 [Chloroflexi bacterium]|nr:2-oxo acid dehydrogenase subunit E2 [Chloroflexota bacterium]